MWYYKTCGKQKGLEVGSVADRIQGKLVCELSREMQSIAGKREEQGREKAEEYNNGKKCAEKRSKV